MNVKRAGRAIAVLAAVCGAGLGSAGAAAASQATVAWGTTTSAPAGVLGQLFGVATASSTDVLAVGGYNPGGTPTAVLTRPYAEHRSGAEWHATNVPLGQIYPAGEQAAQLNGVTEPAPGNGWAVGTVSNLSSGTGASQTLAFHWNGTAWTRSPTPDPAGPAQPNQLNAVAARATTDVWATGSDNFPEASLVLHFNGSTWSQVSVPDIGSLDAVTVAPGRVWIAGGDQVAQFNGTTWTKLPAPQSSPIITGLAHTAAGLWAAGYVEFSCGEGGICTASWAALWNGTTWTVAPGVGGTELSGVAAAGSQVLATSQTQVWRLSLTGATVQVTPALDGQLSAIAADPAGNPWAVGSKIINAQGTGQPAIINAPGIGQGGITVTTGAANATVTWAGPVTGSGGTDPGGRLAVGGLPDGSYTVTAGLPGCQPGIATAMVTAGIATPVNAHITCPP
jgi:hypothetical protein